MLIFSPGGSELMHITFQRISATIMLFANKLCTLCTEWSQPLCIDATEGPTNEIKLCFDSEIINLNLFQDSKHCFTIHRRPDLTAETDQRLKLEKLFPKSMCEQMSIHHTSDGAAELSN